VAGFGPCAQARRGPFFGAIGDRLAPDVIVTRETRRALASRDNSDECAVAPVVDQRYHARVRAAAAATTIRDLSRRMPGLRNGWGAALTSGPKTI